MLVTHIAVCQTNILMKSPGSGMTSITATTVQPQLLEKHVLRHEADWTSPNTLTTAANKHHPQAQTSVLTQITLAPKTHSRQHAAANTRSTADRMYGCSPFLCCSSSCCLDHCSALGLADLESVGRSKLRPAICHARTAGRGVWP